MKREVRHRGIVDLRIDQSAVDLKALALHIGVAKMTIHRDLAGPEAQGVPREVRRGATIQAGTRRASGLRLRARRDRQVKERMTQAAPVPVKPGMTVPVDDGTMAAHLVAIPDTAAPHHRAGLDVLERIITDAPPQPDVSAAIKRAGSRLTIAGSP